MTLRRTPSASRLRSVRWRSGAHCGPRGGADGRSTGVLGPPLTHRQPVRRTIRNLRMVGDEGALPMMRRVLLYSRSRMIDGVAERAWAL